MAAGCRSGEGISGPKDAVRLRGFRSIKMPCSSSQEAGESSHRFIEHCRFMVEITFSLIAILTSSLTEALSYLTF